MLDRKKIQEVLPLRNRLIDLLNLSVVLLGSPVLVIGIIESARFNRPVLGFIYFTNFIPLVLLYLIKSRISHLFRAICLLICIYIFAVYNVYAYGFSGAGIPIFFLYFFFSALFFDFKGGLIAICSAIPPVSFIAWLLIRGRHNLIVDLYLITRLPVSWLTAITVLIFLGLILAISVHVMKNGLERSILVNKKQADELQKVSMHLSDLLNEKSILIQELHHRVKNNLSIITILLYLKGNSITDQHDAVQAFDEARTQISSIALVHEKLYQSDNLSRLDMNDFLKSLVEEVLGIYDSADEIHVDYNIDDIELSIKHAIPCAIIVNEAVTNAYKYAFSKIPDKRLHLYLKKEDTLVNLGIKDNGVGFVPKHPVSSYKSLGLQIIEMQAKQIGGSVEYYSRGGTELVISFETCE